ncbi:MAG: hypothetical protein JXO22_15200, partial [Phycisphaerae bacterium]|nr:hypothetical protein [Phycisphaerae bacterium]
ASACQRLWITAPSAVASVESFTLAPSSLDASTNQPVTAVTTTEPLPWAMIILGGYVAGLLALIALRVWGYAAFRRHCMALPVVDDTTQATVRRVCQHLGLRRCPMVRMMPRSRASFVMGFVRPMLVLSHHHLARPDELETVVVHELTHLRRGDMLVRILQCVAGTMLFFWPVIAWVNRRINRVREHACDERALRHGRLSASEYARCLLTAAQPMRIHPVVYRPACMAGNPSTIERRIDVILAMPNRPERRSKWRLAGLALVCAWTGFALTGAASAGDKTKKQCVKPEYAATEKAMREHAAKVYEEVNQYAAGDCDDSGDVSKEECWTFIATAMMLMPEKVLQTYPDADLNGDGTLELSEAFRFGRGDPELEKTEKLQKEKLTKLGKTEDEAAMQQAKMEAEAAMMETYHVILDRRSKLLAMMEQEPTVDDVNRVSQQMAQIEAGWALDDCKKMCESEFAQISELKTKAAELRAKAAESEGNEAKKLITKAEMAEEKAAQITKKLGGYLEEQVSSLESIGQQRQADEVKSMLSKLQSL